MNDENTVMKALTPEEKTLLANVKAGIEEILNISAAGGESNENGMQAAAVQPPKPQQTVAMAEDRQETTPKLEESPDKKVEECSTSKVKKETTSQPGDTASAQDKTETRIEDPEPEGSEEALAEISKAFAKFFGVNKSVKKTAPINPIVEVMAAQQKAMKSQNDKIDMLAKGLSELMDGMGITKQLEIAEEEVRKAEIKPITNPDSDLVIKHLADLIKGNQSSVEKQFGTPQMQNQEIVRKNSHTLAEWLLSDDSRDQR
jgi:hypothetical protein